jgi:SAM-dependent methyltransferase
VSVRAAAALSGEHVTGIDLSLGMLEQARNKAQQQNLHNIHFRQMDMEALEFDDHQFDAATCSFGLFFIEDMEQCLRNIGAKVKPGGKLAISTFMADAFEPMTSVFMRRYESFGKESREASWKRIASVPALRDLYAVAGMDDVAVHHETLSYPITAQDWWNIVWNAGYRGYLQQLSDEELAEFQAQHMAEVEQLCIRGNDHLNVGVLIAVATKL